MKFDLDKQIDAALPFLFPVPAAWTVYEGLTLMNFPGLVAFSGALGVELFGLRAARLSTRMKDHNDSHKNKTEIKLFSAPMKWVYSLSFAYLIITGAIIFSMKGFTVNSFVIYSFPVFSLSGGLFSGLANDQNKRESSRQASRGVVKVVASKPKKPASKVSKPKIKKQVKQKKLATGRASDEQILAEYEKNSKINNKQLSKVFGMKSGEAIRLRKISLVKKGLIKIVDGAVVVQ